MLKKINVKKNKLLILTLASILLYIFVFVLIRISLKFIPNLFLWKSKSVLFELLAVKFQVIDILYFLLGLIVTTHGLVNLILITSENHKAQNMNTRKPEFLITTGYYSKVRHPMYGTFMIINFGLFFSSRSLWGIIVVLLCFLVQYFNTKFEERKLVALFQEKYKSYQLKVTHKFFPDAYKVYLTIGGIITIIGVIKYSI